MKIFYCFFCCLLLFGCGQNESTVLSPDKMEIVLWELTQADAFTQEFTVRDTSKDLEKENLKLQQRIFAKNNTDRKSFYKSYDYYIKHEELLKPLLDTMLVRNGRIREKLRLKKIIKADDEQIK